MSNFLELTFHDSNLFVKCCLLLFLAKALWILADIVHRTVEYAMIKRNSRKFIASARLATNPTEFADLLPIAKRFESGHITSIYLTGLSTFLASKEFLPSKLSVSSSLNASRIKRNLIFEQLRSSSWSLASIAATAPFMGIFATLVSLFTRFFGPYTGSKQWAIFLFSAEAAKALVPSACGLFVGILAISWANSRNDRIANLLNEMEIGLLDLEKLLGRK
jgi:biopolymer transport protein ExbB/TolQ